VLGVLEAAEPELMSVLAVPVVEPVAPVAEPVVPAVVSVEVPEAPIEVPLPVAPAVVPVLLELGVVPSEPEPLAVLLVLSVVDGIVLELDEEVAPAPASSFLPQAVRDRAAIRARAAHCAIGDLIIQELLGFHFESSE
jgi:hypothetical protein